MPHDRVEVFRPQQINTHAFWQKENIICFHAKGKELEVPLKPKGT